MVSPPGNGRFCQIVSVSSGVVELVRNVMAHAQKPDLVFQRNGRVHLNRRGFQISRLLAADACASAVVMLDRPSSDTVQDCWLPTPFAYFPFTSPPVRHRVPSDSERAVLQSFSPDPHSKKASTRLNWHPCRYKWTLPFRWKTKYGFCACAITSSFRSTPTVILNNPVFLNTSSKFGNESFWFLLCPNSLC